MLESDGGVFRPTGFGFTGSDAGAGDGQRDRDAAARHPGRSDRRRGRRRRHRPERRRPGSIPAMSLDVDGNYFLIHHTPADTVDKIDPMDMARASAAIAVMAYVIADMPERLKLTDSHAASLLWRLVV